jgi:sorbitol/mannitol transport system permease protein
MALRQRYVWVRAGAGWTLAILMFFPVFWMGMAAFKTEMDAIAWPPLFLFHPTLENFQEMQDRVDYLGHAWNSIVVAFGSTALSILLATPAAYAMAFFPSHRTRGTLLWILSNKFMPAAGALVPIYLILIYVGWLDTLRALIILNLFANLPIVVWMLYSYFKEIPADIIEASRLDGANTYQQLTQLLLPLAAPGLASTATLAIILSWNEAFWCINVASTNAGTLALAVASFSNPEGFFWAKLSAVSLASVLPIMAFGWLTQRQLVRGLTFGAVK